MVLTGQKYLCKINWLLFARIFVPAKKAYCTKLSILEAERTHKPSSHKPRSGQNIFSNSDGGKRSKIVFSSGPEESEILSRKVGPRTCKGRELWSQNVADMHLRREKKHLRRRPLTAPVSFQLFARLSLIADNPPSTSPKFCGHLRLP